MAKQETSGNTRSAEQTRVRRVTPSLFKVLMHNDDYTTMEFVIEILMRVFRKSEAQATKIMLAVHNEGVGVCGTYTAEVAEVKVDTVHRLARAAGFPLRCSMEGV